MKVTTPRRHLMLWVWWRSQHLKTDMHSLTQHKSMFWETILGFGKGSRNHRKGVWGGLQTDYNQKSDLYKKKCSKCCWPAELGVGSSRALCPSKEPAQCEPSRSPGPEHYWQCVSIGVSIGDYHHHKISGVENITMRRVFIWSDLFSCRNIF